MSDQPSENGPLVPATLPQKPRARTGDSHGLKYGLRQVLIILTVSGLWLGWFAEQARKQKQVERMVDLINGSLAYSRLPGSDVAWLRRVLGEEYFRRARSVSLYPPNGDDELAQILQCPAMRQVESLSLSGVGFTDLGLRRLASFGRLKSLLLRNTRVTDRGVMELCAALPELSVVGHPQLQFVQSGAIRDARSLDLSGPHLTDAGLQLLSACTGLENLILDESLVTDDGLQVLQTAAELRELSLRRTRIGAQGLHYLVGCPQLHKLDLTGVELDADAADALSRLRPLRELVLDHTHLDDQQLARLRSLPDLRSLSLRCTAITDDGLPLLAGFPSLQEVNLMGTRLSVAGRRRLTEAAKHLRLYY